MEIAAQLSISERLGRPGYRASQICRRGSEKTFGSLAGAAEFEDPSFRYQYGRGDELKQIDSGYTAGGFVDETGAYGRILSRNGAPFSYHAAVAAPKTI